MTSLEIIFSNTVIVSALGYLFKVLIEKRLSHSLNKELELFRTDLAKEISKSSIQESWNHSKRMELLSQLYEKMVEFEFELKNFFVGVKVNSQDTISDRGEKVLIKYLEINSLIHKNELFLEDDIIQEIKLLYEPFNELAFKCFEKDSTTELNNLIPPDINVMELAESPRKKVLKKFKQYTGLFV